MLKMSFNSLDWQVGGEIIKERGLLDHINQVLKRQIQGMLVTIIALLTLLVIKELFFSKKEEVSQIEMEEIKKRYTRR